MSTCDQFCNTLVSATNGVVKRGDNSKTGGAKRNAKKRSNPGPRDHGEPPKKKSKESNAADDAVEDQIASSFIGECNALT